jgi:Sel1 repeat
MRALTILLTIAGLVMVSPALADTTVTITTNNVTCQVPPPAEVPAPATPSVAAGVQAARNKDFALARANFSPLAANGDAEAERAMGQLLMQDCTGLQDKDAGANWLSKAADAGNIQAAAELGNAYMTGRGVAEDDNKAIPLLQKAADAGVKEAQTNLGYLYTNGRGVPMDKYQGMVWTVKGGEQGAPAALLNIAGAYFKGGALPQDNGKAAYYIYAALERSTGAQRSRFAGTTNDISRALSAADLARASRRALSWSPGPGSLSDVLDDAKRTQARTAKN